MNNTTTNQSTTTDVVVLDEVQAPEATETEAPARNIQRMTVQVPIDVDMDLFEANFGVKGWSPTRAALVAEVLRVLGHGKRLNQSIVGLETK
jgi:hypothetical protein